MAASSTTYGVLFGNTRTQVDKASRSVTLANITLTRSNFPTLADNGAAYRQALQQQLASSVTTMSLDRLQASLAAADDASPARVQVRNAPPKSSSATRPPSSFPSPANPSSGRWRTTASSG